MKTVKKENNGKTHEDKIFAYFKAFVDDMGVAAVTPSSKFLVNRVVKAMDLRGCRVVVEYGAAEGVITRKILEGLPQSSTLVAFELNDKLFAGLARIEDPRLKTLHQDVRHADKALKEAGILQADVVVSGIPFAFLSTQGRHDLLVKTAGLLKPGGRFVAYQVTTHLIPLLKDYFKRVDIQFELRNLPPHFVFTAVK